MVCKDLLFLGQSVQSFTFRGIDLVHVVALLLVPISIDLLTENVDKAARLPGSVTPRWSILELAVLSANADRVARLVLISWEKLAVMLKTCIAAPAGRPSLSDASLKQPAGDIVQIDAVCQLQHGLVRNTLSRPTSNLIGTKSILAAVIIFSKEHVAISNWCSMICPCESKYKLVSQ